MLTGARVRRFASKEDWLVPHKEGAAFKELKAWQASSGIQVRSHSPRLWLRSVVT